MKPRNFPDRVNRRKRAALLREGWSEAEVDSKLLQSLRTVRTKKRRAVRKKAA